MEMNLISTEEVGQTKGWLYTETKELVEKHHAILTLSGDTPWLNRLVTSYANDMRALSRSILWVPDPPVEKMQQLLASKTIVVNEWSERNLKVGDLLQTRDEKV